MSARDVSTPNMIMGRPASVRDVLDVARDPDVDVLVELIGGTTVAHDLIKLAIQHGKHVVTANKALIAEHGNELIALAEAAGVQIRYEAAVAGGYTGHQGVARIAGSQCGHRGCGYY
jgi:homoserine dehydrogenase